MLAFPATAGARDQPQAAAAAPGPVTASPATVAGGTITGTVTDPGGVPLQGARVSLTGPTSSSTSTKSDGSFAFPSLANGLYRLGFVRTGYAPFDTTVNVTAGNVSNASVQLAVATQTNLRTIGRVTTSTGAAQLNTTPAAINSISQQTFLDRGQAQVTNALEDLPGVEIQRFSSGGAPGANAVASVRGSDPSETQTLIDGHPISGGPEGDYLIQFLNTDLLGGIEVIKGPGAYGNFIQNQVNGTINYKTLPISHKLDIRASGTYDSYNGSRDSLRISDTVGKFGFLAAYAVYGTPGYQSAPILSVAANATPAVGVIPDATATEYIGAGQTFFNHSELLKLAYTFSPSTAVDFSYLGLHTYVDYTSTLTTEEPFHIVGFCPNTNAAGKAGPGTGAGCGPQTGSSGLPTYTAPGLLGLVGQTVYASSANDNLYLGNFENDNEPFFTGEFRTTFGPGTFLGRYYTDTISRQISDPEEAFQIVQCDDPACSPSVASANGDLSGAFFQTQSDYLHGADFRYEIPVGRDVVSAAYDTHGDRTTACSGGEANPSTCSVPSILQSSQTISARGDLAFGSATALDLALYDSHETFVKTRFDPRVGFTYQPNQNVVIRAAGGSAYVAPAAEVAYDIVPHVNRTTFVSGPATLPETSVSYDVGSDIRTGRDSKLSADVYLTRLFNRFNTVTATGVNGTFDGAKYTETQTTFNDGSALEKGIELTYIKAPVHGFGTVAYLNFLRAYGGNSNPNYSSPGGTVYGNVADGVQFPSYPFTHGRVELNYVTENQIRGAIGASYAGSENSYDEPGFVLFDANAQALLKHDFRLGVAMSNIFNKDDYRNFGIYNYGQSLPALGGGVSGSTLYFAPPRQLFVTLTKDFGRGATGL